MERLKTEGDKDQLRAQVQSELYNHHIGSIEVINKTEVTIPVVPVKPAVVPGKENDFITSTKATLKELGIPEGAVTKVNKTLLSVEDNSPEADENQRQTLELFTFKNEDINRPAKPSPLVIFSHGGKIHQSVIESSGYLATIFSHYLDVNLIALNHRGSHSHAEKADSNFDTREADVLIALDYALKTLELGRDWDGRVFLFGDSMGGHVAATLAGKLDVDGVILTEPAAYSEQAQHTYWIYPDHKFPSGDKFKKRYADKPLFSARPEHLKNAGIPDNEVVEAGLDPNEISGILQKYSAADSPAFRGLETLVAKNPDARVLLISMAQDEIVPGSVIEQYRNSVENKRKGALTEIIAPGGHGSTTPEEVIAIKEFLK